MLPRRVPVSSFRRKAIRILADLREDPQPLLLTEHGRDVAVLLDATTYRLQVHTLALLEGIVQGQMALLEGRTLSHEEVLARTATWA